MSLLIDSSYIIQHDIIFICNNPSKEFIRFQSDLKCINAAGGIVNNANNEVLMIYKNNIWDLPKGKIEHNESDSIAAFREVYEETNVSDLSIVSSPIHTYHIYTEQCGNQLEVYFKKTTWFLMKTKSYNKLVPQFDEYISDVKWVSPNLFLNIKMYKSVRCLLSSVMNMF